MSISDTIGEATPEEIARLLDDLLPEVPLDCITMHFHYTYGKGVDNVLKSS